MATWNPMAQWPVIVAKPFVPEVSVSNLLARKATNTTNITWNITFPMAGITCDLYKSTDGKNYSLINTQVSSEDTACNFNYVDNSLPAAGSNAYYLVKASKSGYTSITSDTGIISSKPTLFAYGVLGNLLQGIDAPSTPQIYQLSGINLFGNVTVTPPSPFEVSIDGTNWFTNSNPLVILSSGNAITNQNIYIRINGTTPGIYSDSIRHTTSGGTTVSVYVKGRMLTIPLLHDSKPMIEWPLTTSMADSVNVRSEGIVATTPTISSMLGLSTIATPPAFSAKGIAFATNPATGVWTVAQGLNRNCYIQFSVKADASHSIRIDTLLLNASNMGSANGTIGVVYSHSGFIADSSDIASAIGTTGLGLPASNYGAFAHPAKIGKTATIGNNDSTLSFLPDSSFIINPNDSLTIRLYFGLGSSNPNRFDYLKNVLIKGHSSVVTLPLHLLAFTGSIKQGITNLSWSTANEVSTSLFILEKSTDATEFNVLTTVLAHNNSGTNIYNFSDHNTQKGIVYYRLKMVDKNGSFSYSKIIQVAMNNKTQFNLFPNPVHNKLTIDFNGASTNTQATVLSLTGKELIRQPLQEGILNKTIGVSQLSKGTYLLVIKGQQGELSASQFTKE